MKGFLKKKHPKLLYKLYTDNTENNSIIFYQNVMETCNTTKQLLIPINESNFVIKLYGLYRIFSPYRSM